jgi:hypothetical protein
VVIERTAIAAGASEHDPAQVAVDDGCTELSGAAPAVSRPRGGRIAARHRRKNKVTEATEWLQTAR